ncbi:hypothetical protein G5V59_17855 [Nocardioides sp. W3-2-3]|nr:hypothetical protein [Nocardioides convexus]
MLHEHDGRPHRGGADRRGGDARRPDRGRGNRHRHPLDHPASRHHGARRHPGLRRPRRAADQGQCPGGRDDLRAGVRDGGVQRHVVRRPGDAPVARRHHPRAGDPPRGGCGSHGGDPDRGPARGGCPARRPGATPSRPRRRCPPGRAHRVEPPARPGRGPLRGDPRRVRRQCAGADRRQRRPRRRPDRGQQADDR